MKIFKFTFGLAFICASGAGAVVPVITPQVPATTPIIIAVATALAQPKTPVPNSPVTGGFNAVIPSGPTATGGFNPVVPSVPSATDVFIPVSASTSLGTGTPGTMTATASTVTATAAAIDAPLAAATPVPVTPVLPTAASLWQNSQSQIAQITASENDGSLTASQAVALRAEVRALRVSYGLRRSSDSTKLNDAQGQALSQGLELQAEKISQAIDNP